MYDFEEWLTTQKAAEVLEVTPRRVRDFLGEGRLIGRKVNPRLWMVSRASVETLQQRRRQRPDSD